MNIHLSARQVYDAPKRDILRRTALLLLLSALLAAVAYAAGAGLGVVWHDRTARVDLSGDGKPETLVLARRILTVTDAAGEAIWQSEPGWRVQDFLTGDINGDGLPELLMLVEKRGSYGSARPFWVERDETGYSQHIFIFRWNGQAGAPRPLWMASALPVRVRSFAIEADGVTVRLVTAAGEETFWRWESFGLARVEGARGFSAFS